MTNITITESELVSQAISTSPRIYNIIIKQVQGAKGTIITVDDLEEQMEDLYYLYKEYNRASEDVSEG